MGSRPTTFQVALQVGASSTYVDVSDYLESYEDFTHRWGRESGFDSVEPREFSFVLKNDDGRFTPDNTSTYPTSVTEGIGVSWLVNSRLIGGTVTAIEPLFPGNDVAWAKVRITAMDDLGKLARVELRSLTSSVVSAASPVAWWELGDPSGSGEAQESQWLGYSPLTATGTFSFGESKDWDDEVSLVELGDDTTTGRLSADFPAASFARPATEPVATIGFWAYRETGLSLSIQVYFESTLGDNSSSTVITSGTVTLSGLAGSQVIANTDGLPHYYEIAVSQLLGSPYTYTHSLYLDGTLVATSNETAGSPLAPTINVQSVSITGKGLVSNFAIFAGLTLLPQRDVYPTTLANRIALIQQATPTVAYAALPAGFPNPQVGMAPSGISALDAFNDIMQTVQGHIYTATTGTLLAPVQEVTLRGRDRPETSLIPAFENEADMSGVINFVRDNTFAIATATAEGPSGKVTYTDITQVARLGQASDKIETIYEHQGDLSLAAQDRIYRGRNTGLRAKSFTIDAIHTATDRMDDLLSVIPGDRVQLADLPQIQFGFQEWDGWIVGASEVFNTIESSFEIFTDQTLPDSGIYDTDRYMAGGDLTLSSALTAVATSMSVATTGAPMETVDVPYTMTIDTEEVTVTACTSATPQVATITRGVNGTTAAAHSSGAEVEMATATLYAY